MKINSKTDKMFLKTQIHKMLIIHSKFIDYDPYFLQLFNKVFILRSEIIKKSLKTTCEYQLKAYKEILDFEWKLVFENEFGLPNPDTFGKYTKEIVSLRNQFISL